MFAARAGFMTGVKVVEAVAVRATARNSMPTHQAGDLLLGCTYTPGDSSSIPALPSGWTSIHALNASTYSSGSGTIKTPGAWYGTRVAWKIATSSSESISGSGWSDYFVTSVYNAVSIGGTQTKGGGVANGYSTLSTPDITLEGTGSALFAYINGFTGSTFTPNSGWTNLATFNDGSFSTSMLVKTNATSGSSSTVGSFASLPYGWSVSCVAAIEVKNA